MVSECKQTNGVRSVTSQPMVHKVISAPRGVSNDPWPNSSHLHELSSGVVPSHPPDQTGARHTASIATSSLHLTTLCSTILRLIICVVL